MRKKKELKDTDFGIAEDLAPQIHQRMKKIKHLPIIDKCWSVDGKIKYIKKSESMVKMIQNEKDAELLLTSA